MFNGGNGYVGCTGYTEDRASEICYMYKTGDTIYFKNHGGSTVASVNTTSTSDIGIYLTLLVWDGF